MPTTKIVQRCVRCDEKPARRLLGGKAGKFFCTLKCAARYALDNAPEIYQWCPDCGEWSHPDDWNKPEGDKPLCPNCGVDPECPTCLGNGRIPDTDEKNSPWRKCLDCNGTGKGA